MIRSPEGSKPIFFENKADFFSVSAGSTKHTSNCPSGAHFELSRDNKISLFSLAITSCWTKCASVNIKFHFVYASTPLFGSQLFLEAHKEHTSKPIPTLSMSHFFLEVHKAHNLDPLLPSLCLALFQRHTRRTLSTPFLPSLCPTSF